MTPMVSPVEKFFGLPALGEARRPTCSWPLRAGVLGGERVTMSGTQRLGGRPGGEGGGGRDREWWM